MTIHAFAFLFVLLVALLPMPASAHCDTTKGPVVASARVALERSDVNLVLQWVRPEDEETVRAAFEQTLAVRKLSAPAKHLADRYFFETLVRIHRGGEGAPYTGLSDGDPEPIILATDRALAQGDRQNVENQLIAAMKTGLAERFEAANRAKQFQPGDVKAGRAYVAAYVSLAHWTEGVLAAAEGAGEHHASDGHAATADHGAMPRDRSEAKPQATGSHGYLQLLPWAFTTVLAIAALIEGALLLRRRRDAAA